MWLENLALIQITISIQELFFKSFIHLVTVSAKICAVSELSVLNGFTQFTLICYHDKLLRYVRACFVLGYS